VTTDTAPRMLSKFEPFQRLPSELRHEIWTLALPSFASSVKILIGVYSYDKAKRGIPPLLHCCHESRAVALNYYKLGFKVKSQSLGRDSWPVCPNLQATTKLNSQLYWDPKEDIVCLEPLRETFEPSYFPGATSHSCKHLCKHYIATMDPEARQLEMRGELWKAFYPLASRGFSGLESITVVLANDFRIRYPLYAPMTDQEYSNDYRALIQRSQPPSVQCHARFAESETGSQAS